MILSAEIGANGLVILSMVYCLLLQPVLAGTHNHHATPMEGENRQGWVSV